MNDTLKHVGITRVPPRVNFIVHNAKSFFQILQVPYLILFMYLVKKIILKFKKKVNIHDKNMLIYPRTSYTSITGQL